MTSSANFPIFVVDDEVSVADTVSEILCAAGFEITTFCDPLHAVQHALEAEPDAVVTDYSMPNMNDLELATRLQKLYPACRIVLPIGLSEVIAAQPHNGVKLNMLQKPVPPLTLIRAVQ